MRPRKAEDSNLTSTNARSPTPGYVQVDPRLGQPTKPRGRRRLDPLAAIWDDVIVPMLQAAPGLRPISVFREISRHHPEIDPCVRRTLQRRIRHWQSLNDPDPEVSFRQGSSINRCVLAPSLVFNFLRSAHQGTLQLLDLPPQARAHNSILEILDFSKSGTLLQRSKALLALAVVCKIPLSCLAKYPISNTKTLYRWKQVFEGSGFKTLMKPRSKEKLRFKDAILTTSIFKILHEPPGLHGFPRTNWRQVDLKNALDKSGAGTSIWTIRRAIRANKYQWRKAKVVLTSNDPDYRIKVDRIKQILSELGDDERFFSIDEYGPFTVRFMQGKKLCAPDESPSVPQWQKGRGTVILTGALELRTNQITHFYSERKNTDEMIKMVEILRREYGLMKRLYVSWDAAGWHL